MVYPDKLVDLMKAVKACVDEGRYLDTRHATDRQLERFISRPEVLYVLKHGHHEKRKDQFDVFYRVWNYAVKGKTIDRREMRVIVSFDPECEMLIITAIDLAK